MGVIVREKVPGSGIYWIFVSHQGKRKSKRIGSESAAKEAAAKIEARLTLGDFAIEDKPQKKPLFKEYAGLWRDGYIKPLRRPSTYERYGDILKNYVNPAIGDMEIDTIKRRNIRDLFLKLHQKKYSRSTICLCRDVISGVLGHAVDDELIEANPVSGILKRLNLDREKQLQVEPLTSEEVKLFLETCKQICPEYHVFFLCGFRAGMRLGELIGLQWGDIDFNKQNIHVQRSFRRGAVNAPKNGKIRVVDMSDYLMEQLKALYTQRKKEALKEGGGDPIEIIFHREGAYMDQKYIRRIFKRILKKAGMRDHKPHVMRHTFASLLLSNGESPVYVKEQLGHSSINITVDIYGHLIPSSNRAAVNRLDDDCKPVQEGAYRVQNGEK